jgi:glycosyltransferase involved in cell wall biosynthesis
MERAHAARMPRDPDAPVRLLMVGRLAAQKGHATALDALARLGGMDWRLTIAGQGPLRDALERRCADLGIAGRVTFAGYVADPRALAALMGEADILLQPSCWEGLCATLIEALACGAQVVAADCTPNIRPILSAAGQHPPVPVGDAAALARAIERTLAQPAPLHRLADAVRDHGVDRALDRYLRAMESLVDTPMSRPGVASAVLMR